MNKEIVNIVRDRKGNPRGYVVAAKLENGKVGLGWSYVNVKAGDRFDKHLGQTIAMNRVFTGTDKFVPRDVMKVIDRVSSRAVKYFRAPIEAYPQQVVSFDNRLPVVP